MTTPSDNVMELLTAYALDALEPEEAVQVLQLLEEQPDLRQTLAELRAAAAALPYALPEAEPPPDLRQRTLDYAVGRQSRTPQPAVGTSRRLRGWIAALGVVAAVAIIAAAVAWSQLAAARAEIAFLRQQQQMIAATIAQPVALATLQGDQGHGTVLRNANGAVIFAAHLPPLPPNRVYQLWLINGANAPVSGGTFSVDEQGNGMLTLAPDVPAPSADTFAVTNEPEGGSPGPTTPPLISGKAGSA